jgi:hypothetical protein
VSFQVQQQLKRARLQVQGVKSHYLTQVTVTEHNPALASITANTFSNRVAKSLLTPVTLFMIERLVPEKYHHVTNLITAVTWDNIKAVLLSVPGFQPHSSIALYATHETISVSLQAGALAVAVVAAPATLSTAALCACAGGAVLATRVTVGALWGLCAAMAKG